MRKIILIGGAPAIGKTTLAAKLSKELGMPWISTDSIREVMRTGASIKDNPNLFYFTDKKAEVYLKSHSPKEVVVDQNKESIDVWKGAKSFIDSARDYDSKIKFSYIIEGVAILPSLIYKDFPDSDFIKPIFLLDSNKDRIKEVVYTRGLWAEAKKYSDDVKDLEVEWVLAFNDWLKEELKKYNYSAIETGDKKDLVLEIKNLLK